MIVTRHASLDIDISRGRWGAVGERKEDWIWAVEGAVFAYKEGSIMRRESVVVERHKIVDQIVLFCLVHDMKGMQLIWMGGRDKYR